MDDDTHSLGIRRSNEDKLIYKTEIQDAIRQCRRCKGLIPTFKHAVEGLVMIIEFDISGYKFFSQIQDIKKQLRIEKTLRFCVYLEEYGLEAGHPINIANYRNEEYTWYYQTLFQRVLQMLASENMLIEDERWVPYKKLDRITHGE